MSKVIFKASKFLSDDEINAELYLRDIDTRSWVDYCDGKEVIMENEWMGCPYDKNIEKTLQIISDNQYRYVMSLFKDVYDAKGVYYERDDKGERTT